MCGIVGVHNAKRPVAGDLYVALMNLQHRGKESAGIATFDGVNMKSHVGMGEVPQAFVPDSLNDLAGKIGIGHTRYSTAGFSSIENAQPIRGLFKGREFFLAHNGNLINSRVLSREAGLSGIKLDSDCSDTRVIAALVSASKKARFEDAVMDVLPILQGSFNLLFIFNGTIIATKDSFGFHPLQVGERGEGYIISSESCVFDHLNAKLIRDISPGEMVIINDKKSPEFITWTENSGLSFDIFEYIYFLRPDSVVHGVEAGEARYRMGQYLADEYPLDVDIVIPIPDSGNEAALGYYERMLEKGAEVQFRPWALFRPHTVSRTFIEPVQAIRREYLKLKFNPRQKQLEGKRVAAIDDSLVRGTTEEFLDVIMHEAGVRELYSLKSSPVYASEDIYGIDTYRIARELIGKECEGDAERVLTELRRRVQTRIYSCGLPTSLDYLSLDSTIQAVLDSRGKNSDLTEDSFYTGPFTGIYPAGKGDIV